MPKATTNPRGQRFRKDQLVLAPRFNPDFNSKGDGHQTGAVGTTVPAVPDRTEPGPETAVRDGELRALDERSEDADLMAQREDL